MYTEQGWQRDCSWDKPSPAGLFSSRLQKKSISELGQGFGPDGGEATQIRLDGTATPQQIRLGNPKASPDASVARTGETLRQSEWRDVLLKGGVRGKGGQTIDFSRVEPLGGGRWLHADAETKGVKPEPVVISFGPEYAPLEQRQVELAWEKRGNCRLARRFCSSSTPISRSRQGHCRIDSGQDWDDFPGREDRRRRVDQRP